MNPPSFEDPFQGDRLNVASNFRPEWDVPSIGREISASLNRDIEAVRKHTEPDPNQKIHVLVGAQGFGKTHLFGRILHQQGTTVLFVFVPHADDAGRTVANVQWSIVETLFQPDADGVTPLGRSLAQLLRPSLEAYFDQLPPPLQSKYSVLRKRLGDDWRTVLDIVHPVTELTSYHALADSLSKRLPSLPSAVLRALVLGLSPVADEARCWLRGEPRYWLRAEESQAERSDPLRLGENPPPVMDVLRTVAVLIQKLQTPLLLCLDQIEALLVHDNEQLQKLTTESMGWLQEVPNLIIIMSCLQDRWGMARKASFASFDDRIYEHRLLELISEQAMELIRRRVRTWDEYQPEKGDGWPFDLASAEWFVERTPISPRSFINECRKKFEDWQGCSLREKAESLIRFDGRTPPPISPVELFRQEWMGQLVAIEAEAKAAVHYQEAELWECITEAVEIARLGRLFSEGTTLDRIQNQALKPTANDPRPSAELHLSAGNEQRTVVVAVTKKDAGAAFAGYVKALEKAMGGNVVGAVVIWPKAQLGVGPQAASYVDYRESVNSGKIRPFPLDENGASFAQIVCLRRLIKAAEINDLVLDGRTLSPEDCRRLTVEAGLLDHLKLFQILFENWPELEAAPAAVGRHTREVETAVASDAVLTHPRPGNGKVDAQSTQLSPTSGTSRPADTTKLGGEPVPDKPGMVWAKSMLDQVVTKLRNWGQPVTARGVEVGPSFVRLMVVPRDQTDFSKVRTKADNLKLQLGLERRPIIDAQAGYISIDVQRLDRQAVPLLPLFADRPERLAGQPAFPIGVDVTGRTHWLNLAEPSNCHLLVSGTTGSGKSEFMKAVLAALAHTLGPHELQFVLIDPKQVTFNLPGGSPYLRREVAYDVNDALPLIEECVDEMERRYTLLRQRQRENVSELTGADAVPRWVLIFDEFADLMVERGSKKELEALLKRLGAKARAAGIHLVLGTQRAEATVVTPLLRSNLPGRISLEVISERDSKLILDAPDAAYLLGKGDLLWRQGGGLTRLQCPLVSREELATRLRCH